MTRPDIRVPAPITGLLGRRLVAPPDTLDRLRALTGAGAPPVAGLARGRRYAATVVEEHRAARPELAGLVAGRARWRHRRADIALRLDAAARPHRTPQQVLDALLVLARRAPAEGTRAAVVATSALAGAGIGALLGTSPTLRALAALGLRVRPMTTPAAGPPAYTVVLPVSARELGGQIEAVAWALGRTGVVTAAWPDRGSLRMFVGGTSSAVIAPAQVSWPAVMVRADRAHQVPPARPGGRARGAGAVIAHPDTGWAPHPQYAQARIDTVRSYDTTTDRSGPNEARHGVVRRAFGSFTLTHGTSTGCLMVGGAGSGPEVVPLSDTGRAMLLGPRVPDARILGIAPAATVLSIKLLSDDLLDIDECGIAGAGVLRVGDGDFVEAIGYARAAGADVVSLSVGGMVSDVVRRAVEDAVAADMIVVAAAGQTYAGNVLSVLSPDDSVIEPARFPGVIAVAGCSTDGLPWSESHRGPNVDITAPGDAVWVADFDERGGRAGAPMPPVVRASSGTSFATAIVAAAAAAWVAHWGGRERLKQDYPRTPLGHVFREVLQRTAGPVSGQVWDVENFGPGVLDVQRLLREPLPPAAEVPSPPATRVNLLTGVESGLRLLGLVLAEVADETLAAGVAILAAAALLETAARDVAEEFARAAAAAGSAAEAVADAAADALTDGEQLLRDAADAADEMARAAADQGEEVVDALVEAVDSVADATGEAVGAVLSLFGAP